MPRAENRKRPANHPGSFAGGGNRNKPGGHSNDVALQKAKESKQELIEKMKKLQAGKNTNVQE